MEAKESMAKAFTIFQSLSPKPLRELAITHFNMGRILTSIGDYAEAAVQFQEANRTYRQLDRFTPSILANPQFHSGEMYRAEESWPQAREMYNQAIELSQGIQALSRVRARAHMRLAELDAQEGNYASALDHLQQAQPLFLPRTVSHKNAEDISQEDLAQVKNAPTSQTTSCSPPVFCKKKGRLKITLKI